MGNLHRTGTCLSQLSGGQDESAGRFRVCTEATFLPPECCFAGGCALQEEEHCVLSWQKAEGQEAQGLREALIPLTKQAPAQPNHPMKALLQNAAMPAAMFPHTAKPLQPQRQMMRFPTVRLDSTIK